MPEHLRAALTQVQLSIPVFGGRMTLGVWQAIYLFEHRARPHEREIALHLIGSDCERTLGGASRGNNLPIVNTGEVERSRCNMRTAYSTGSAARERRSRSAAGCPATDTFHPQKKSATIASRALRSRQPST